MIKIVAIDEDNVYKILKLKVSESQKEFVATNAVSLAECYVYRDNNDVFPYAIMSDDEAIGFVLLETYEEYDALSIWRFMIDHKYQGQGLGFKAMKAIIDFGRTHFSYNNLTIAFVEDNIAARSLYTKLGFKETGVDEYKQITMSYPLNKETQTHS